ncbi:MAG: hypothetical protein HOQ41_10070 [Ensifer adhaerens]|jgi:hypothetical protein|nr:hypothetical protein [Ensifer adhaerens]
MAQLELSSEYYAECGEQAFLLQGEIFHRDYNARGGALSRLVARFYVSCPGIPTEGVRGHTRLDCFVSDRKLAPKPDKLAELVLAALTGNGTISEPIWLSWHHSEEISGRPYGAVFDLD